MEEKIKRLKTLYENEELFVMYIGSLMSADYVTEQELDDKVEKTAELLAFLETQPESEKRTTFFALAKQAVEILGNDKKMRDF